MCVLDEGRLFSEVVLAEIALRESVERRNSELEAQWSELRDELEKLRAKREAAEVEASEVRRKQAEAEIMVQHLSDALNSLTEQNAQLGICASKFTNELQRLERERRAAEKSKQALNDRYKKLQSRLTRRTKEWHQLSNQIAQVPPIQQKAQVPDPEVAKLRQLNSLFARRVDQMKKELSSVKTELSQERSLRLQIEQEKIGAEVFAQADSWMHEATEYKLGQVREELAAERAQNAYLEAELRRMREGNQKTREELIATTQTSSQLELELFESHMSAEQADEERKEALMHASRCQEAMVDAQEKEQQVHASLEKLLEERQRDRLEMAKLIGERDFFEWKLVEKRPSCVEWILPSDQLIEPVEKTDANGVLWHSNNLFGHANLLYTSGSDSEL